MGADFVIKSSSECDAVERIGELTGGKKVDLCFEVIGSNSMVKMPSLAVPQLAPCASSGRAWRLCAARHSQSEAPATGRPATASGAQASCVQRARISPIPLRFAV